MSDWLFLGPPLVAGFFVLLTHVSLGKIVLQRGIIFLDLAIAQVAGLGVIIAHAVGWDISGLKAQAIALGAALLGAFILSRTESIAKTQQEALIGVGFVLAATAGLLLLSHDPHGGDHLRDLLVGQVLWVTWSDLIPLTVVTILFGLLYWRFPTVLLSSYFYFIFATIITFSVQVVGIYLVFSSLVIPALAVYQIRKNKYWIAYFLGALSYISGITVSILFDLPTGASIVWMLAVFSMLYWLFHLIVHRDRQGTN